MDRMDKSRARGEARERRTRLVARRWRGWRSLTGVLLGLGLALGPLLLPAAAWAQTVGKNSCIGEDACLDNTGTVGNDACDGFDACLDNMGASIGNGACDGDFACADNTGTVGNEACVGVEACAFNSGTIGPGQCIGDHVCENNTANIP
jgi:hypothetical protein